MKNALLLISLILMVSCHYVYEPQKEKEKTKVSGDITIFHAGSLSVPFQKIARAFEQDNPGTKVLLEAAGSVDCARKITELKKPCDLMASSDYRIIKKMLIPDYTSWYLPFAGNEIVIAYTDKSKMKDKISAKNWPEILLNEEVHFGRADKDADPCGYRTLMVMQLAALYLNKAEIYKLLSSKDEKYIRPKEVDLLALLEMNEVDYIFIYRSVAVFNGLKFVELPDEVNLKKPQLDEHYKHAKVTIKGSTPSSTMEVTGESIIYAITKLDQAPNPAGAEAFLHYLLDKNKGLKILEECGLNPLIPVPLSSDFVLPDYLHQYTKEPDSLINLQFMK